ncbi:MAG TPA: hypothetical protein PKJ83_16380 [Cyclobacteriaceae bacterium]|nr:hypothetical protein [Cyclobacteriaceae bacterium]
MKLFYVMGGGLGHLYRVRTFINQFHRSPFRILTNNPLAKKLFSLDEIEFVYDESPHELIDKIQRVLNSTRYNELYVDAFPAGLFGELNGVNIQKKIYLARRLNWNNYKSLIKSRLRFDETLCFEELEEEHGMFIKEVSESISSIDLLYPNPDITKIAKELIPQKPIWLIVHSFIIEEVESLVSYAKEVARLEKQDPVFIVLSDQPIVDKDVICYAWFPAQDWFPLAARIFTGGGFNVLKQAAPYKEKISAIPFPRRYDDQAWRVRKFTAELSRS